MVFGQPASFAWGRKRFAALVVAAALAGGLPACTKQARVYAPPASPITRVGHEDYQALLSRYVGDDGRVDYARWHRDDADVGLLDRYLATLTNATPDTRPELFDGQPAKLSYWLNLYNAIVLREILRRWPLASVTEVAVSNAGLLEGKGFFYDLVFIVGGRRLNLHDLENNILRARFKDARIHVAVACGSSSCPLLRNEAFDGAALERQLESASKRFVNDPANVRVDDLNEQVVLSKVFAWYADDFIAFTKHRAHLSRAGVVDFALLYADDALARQLKEAKAKRYRVAFVAYDWRVNKQESALRAPQGAPPVSMADVGNAAPDVELALADGGTWRPSEARGKVVLLDFFATFSRHCQRSFPALQALHEKHASEGLVVVGVAEEEEPGATLPEFLKATGATFPIVVDPEQTASKPPFGVRAIPTHLLIDRRGIVRYRHVGVLTGEREEIVRQIEKLLAEK